MNFIYCIDQEGNLVSTIRTRNNEELERYLSLPNYTDIKPPSASGLTQYDRILFNRDTKTWDTVLNYISQETMDAMSAAISAKGIRMRRDTLLAELDWTQLTDVPESTKQKWSAYRAALRDITLQDTFPNSVIWPTPPQ